MKRLIALISIFISLGSVAQMVTPTPIPTPKVDLPKVDEIIIETEIDENDQIAIQDHVAELKNYFEKEIRYHFSPSLVTVQTFTHGENKVGFKTRIEWEKNDSTFDLLAFNYGIQKSMDNFKQSDPTLYLITRSQPSTKLPGLQIGENFSVNIYGTPISYLDRTTGYSLHNTSYAGKNFTYNNTDWWEGSARLQIFMNLSNVLNMKNNSKILLTAGYYMSFLNVKEQKDFYGYVNNINPESLQFHNPNHGEVNVGIKIILDRKKRNRSLLFSP
ncbi:MAG: hypothetical protein ACOYL6_13100 [Bacteriovoracaceae bacterium]